MPLINSESTLSRQDLAERWLRCRIFKGMFSDELAVQYAPPHSNSTSVFVPKELVEGSVDGEGRVKVRVFHEGSNAWAVLPTENQMIIAVNEADLIS